MPKVSIYIPVYNGENYLEDAVISLLNQTYKDFEVVIVDDGSSDKTPRIAEQLSKSDSRIKVVTHTKNKGLSAARNTGLISISTESEFVMNHDCDDISLPDKLLKLVNFLNNNTEISAVGSFCEYFNDEGRLIGKPLIEWNEKNIFNSFDLFNSMCISSVLMRKSLVKKILPFRKEFGGCDDYDFWARALLNGFKLANVPEVLHKIRLHENNMGKTQKIEMTLSAEKIKRYFFKARNNSLAVNQIIEGIEDNLNFYEKFKYLIHSVFWGLKKKQLGIIKESYILLVRDFR